MLNGDHFSSSNKRPRSKTLLSLPSEMRFLVLKFQILGPRCPDNPFDTCCAHRDFNIPRIKEPSFLMGDHSLGLDFDQTELIFFSARAKPRKWTRAGIRMPPLHLGRYSMGPFRSWLMGWLSLFIKKWGPQLEKIKPTDMKWTPSMHEEKGKTDPSQPAHLIQIKHQGTGLNLPDWRRLVRF